MKKFGFIFSILILAVVLTAGSAMAQNSRKVGINVPFEFNFGGKVFAPGHYSVRVTDNSDSSAVVSLSDEEGTDLHRVLATNATRTSEDKSAILFERSNGQVLLSGITLENGSFVLPKASGTNGSANTKNRPEPRKEKGKTKTT